MNFRVPQIRAVAGLAIGFATLIPPAFSQRGGGAGAGANPGVTTNPGGGVGNNPTPGNPGNNPGNYPGNNRGTYPNPSDPNNPNNRMPDQSRPIFLSGKVMLDDGTPPPGPVTIEKVCNGNPRAQGYTDSKGRFSFQLGQTQGILQDASVSSSGMGGYGGGGQNANRSAGGFGDSSSSRDLMGCEIRANLPGFRSDSINLGARRVFDDPDLGTIILHRMSNVEGVSISMVSLMAPKDAKKAFDKGTDLLKKRKEPEAEKSFEKAVEIYPKYSTAWFEIGRLKESRNDVEGARTAYSKALEADPKYINPYRQLAGISVNEKNWKDVADTTSRLLKLDPVDFPDSYFYNGVANFYLKNLDEAEKSAREAQKLDPNNRLPKATQLLGAILAEKQDYAGAAEQMKKYLALVPNGQDSDLAKKQLADLEKMVVAK